MSAGRRYRRLIRQSAVTAYVVPEIPDDASPEMKNGLAVRNAATMTGRCPACGSVAELIEAPGADRIGRARISHEKECPALLGDQR